MIEGVGPDAEIVTNERGGKQSKVPFAFDLIDAPALIRLAEILKQGAESHGRENWRLLTADEQFNHLLMHLAAWKAGDRSDDHLGHAFCRAMMLFACAEREKRAEKPTLAERLYPTGHARHNCGRLNVSCLIDGPDNCGECKQWIPKVGGTE